MTVASADRRGSGLRPLLSSLLMLLILLSLGWMSFFSFPHCHSLAVVMQGFCFHFFFFCSLCLCLLHLCSAANSTVYFIRHGEKPSEGNGLDAQGVQRAQCLRTVFGKSSQYDIGYIIAEQPKASGARARPYETVEPLAQDLGLTVDTSCSKTDSKCVKKLVKKYAGSGNILICWEHNQLTNIVEALGDEKAPEYPDDSFDIIWTDPSPYSSVTEMTSECCPGLDSC